MEFELIYLVSGLINIFMFSLIDETFDKEMKSVSNIMMLLPIINSAVSLCFIFVLIESQGHE